MRNQTIRSIAVKALLILLTLHAFPITSGAKVRFGVTGGFQLTDMTFSHDDLDKNNRMGWFAGPTVKFTLPIVGLGIDVAALYDQRDLKVDDTVFKQKSVVVQGDARFGVGLGELLGIFFKLGPRFSFNVSDDFV
ncbi:MAG: outer membrane beta-barrel protein, partial [Prevotella sp.]|nr:outer membrane beta-barrel protein [Prevotella sp.]